MLVSWLEGDCLRDIDFEFERILGNLLEFSQVSLWMHASYFWIHR